MLETDNTRELYAHLKGAHPGFKAVPGVEAEALASAHAAGTALPLQRIGPAHPVLHQQAHSPAHIMPALLRHSVKRFIYTARAVRDPQAVEPTIHAYAAQVLSSHLELARVHNEGHV